MTPETAKKLYEKGQAILDLFEEVQLAAAGFLEQAADIEQLSELDLVSNVLPLDARVWKVVKVCKEVLEENYKG